ncbi:MAG: hypothetical protein NW241_10300 [Bacteroidia bacterium]|nr:hypothetical protein [Bacteroidia bacterium]
MIKRLRTYLPGLLLLLIGAAVLYAFFGRVLSYSNQYFFGNGEDAFKNYFTPAWYIKYDSGLHFSGMNHPYGEHILYTDNQPLISLILGWVHRHITPVADITVSILNLLMVVSMLGCMWFLYKIGRLLLLPAWYAIPVAVVLALLSPQIHRLTAHYALSYTVYIPMLWYALLRAVQPQAPRVRWTAIAMGIILIWGFIHAYYLMIGALLGLSFWLVQALVERRQGGKRIRQHLLLGLLTAAVPVLLFQGFMAATDPVTDRPANPYGFFTYRALLHTVFLPVHGPFREAWRRFFPGMPPDEMEGFAYVGLTATVVGVLGVVRIVRYLRRRGFRRAFRPALPAGLGVSVGAGVLMLIFSMAIPFIWGMEFLLDLMPPLRQFRSLGRFAWIFYYLFTMYAAVYLYLIVRRVRMRGLRAVSTGIAVIALGFWGWEAALHLDAHTRIIRAAKKSNFFVGKDVNPRALLIEAGVKPEDFQAVLPVPVFNIGSEKFNSRNISPDVNRQAFKLAYDTGLPLACGAMSRTSVTHSLRLVQIQSSELIPKRILEDLRDPRPLLILKQNNTVLTWEQQQLIARAKPLIEKPDFSLYSLPLELLQSTAPAFISRFEAGRDTLLRYGDFYSPQPVKWVHYDCFDAGGNPEFAASVKTLRKGHLLVFDGPVPVAEAVHASVWVQADKRYPGFPHWIIKEYSPDGKLLANESYPVMFSTQVFDDWVRGDVDYQVKQPGNRLELYIGGQYIAVESLLIAPVHTDLYLPLNGRYRLMFNNYYLAP